MFTARKEKGSIPNFCQPVMVRVQTCRPSKSWTFFVHPTAGPRHKGRNGLTSPSLEPKHLDKWTSEYQECDSHHRHLLLLPLPDEERRRHHHLQDSARFLQYGTLKKQLKSLLKSFALFIERRKLKRQPLIILIPKKGEEPLDQRHTRVTMVQIKMTTSDTPHLPRTPRLLKK